MRSFRDLESSKSWAVWRSSGGPHPGQQSTEEADAREAAWRKLRMRFGPTVTTKQGIILAEFSGMVRKPTTTLGELVAMMTEMDKKIWMIEEMIPCRDGNSPISSLHKKSVLVGIMDPMTRQHTATHHCESFEELATQGVVGVRQQHCRPQWPQQDADWELPRTST